MKTSRGVFGVVAAAGLCVSAWGGEGSLLTRLSGHHSLGGAEACLACRLDQPATGEKTYARSAGADYTHMKLELTVADMNRPVLEAVQTLTLVSPGKELRTLELDARLMKISSVASEGRTVTYDHDGRRLTLTFAPPIPADESATVVTTYEVKDPIRGLYWTPESAAWPGRPAQLYTQGQPETNSYWFPCHDFPNEKLTTELVVTAPQGYEVVSNGKLVERTPRAMTRTDAAGGTELAAFEEWHWLQDKPHVNYLVSLVVGKFDVVDVGTATLPMPVYAPVGRGNDVRATYGRTGAMAEFFGRRLGTRYPWDKYAQTVVWNFVAGGMENTSATTMHDTAIFEARSLLDYDLDGLISHELAHQWFGDLVTCQTWEHIWLNEGWATYMSQLWFEHRDGRGAYDAGIRSLYDGVIANDQGSLPATPGMASRVYEDPWETFRRKANPYGKGASILAMLRAKLGDDAFFRGVTAYLDTYKFGSVVTSDFRRALEDASGENLEQFFAQWVFRPNVPRVALDAAWDDATGTLTLTAKQKQQIDGLNPAFEFDLPVWVRGGAGSEWSKGVMRVRGREATLAMTLDGAPDSIAFDPEQTVIADLTCDHPAARSQALVASGPTFAARIQGMRWMTTGHKPTSKELDVLAAVAGDRSAPAALRVHAVKALVAAKDEPSLSVLATSPQERWEIREAVLAGLAEVVGNGGDRELGRERAGKLMLRAIERDPSTRVKAAAIRGLGTMGVEADQVIAATKLASQDDELRRAALDALVKLNVPAGLPAAIALTKPGVLTRTRADAIETVVKLADHKRDAAFEAIAACVADGEQRPRMAAGKALVDLKDPRGAEVLQKRLLKVDDETERRMIEKWLK